MMAQPLNQQPMEFQLNENQTQKLTDWANEPTILNLKNDFEVAKQSHDALVTKVDHWNNLMGVKGSEKIPKVKGRSSVQPKLIRRQAEWRYSALTEPFLGSNKIFKISPVTFEDTDGATQNELVLNWQFRTKLNRIQFVDNFVRATVDEGTSVVRVGWCRTSIKVKTEVPIYSYFKIEDPQELQVFQQALASRDDNIRGFQESAPDELKASLEYYDENQIPVVAKKVGTKTEMVDQVVENKPTLEVLDLRNFYLDPTCGSDVDNALFAIVSFETNQAELKKNPKRYKNLDKVNWDSNGPIVNPDHETRTPDALQFKDALRRKVVAYEYWGFSDIHGTGKLVPIVVTWIGDTIIRMEENPYPDGKLPFVLVPYLPIKRDVFGQPDAELLEDNQKILGAVTRGMVDLLGRSANGQQGMAKGMLDPLNRRKYEEGRDYEFNPNINPSQGLIEHKYPEIPQSALLMLNLQNQDAEALTGVKSFSGGISGESYGPVAAGIRGTLDAASKREMAILRRLAKGVVDIGTKIISMNAVFLSEKEVVRVTNEKFVTISREDLKGNFDLDVDISTAEVDNQKSQDLAFMLQTMGPNMPPDFSQLILAEIAELKRMPDLAHKIKTYKPQPDPVQEQLKQLEVLKTQKEIAVLDSEIALNQARSKQLSSTADKTDLDFVEQESGTTHARDMEKQRGQAEGNQDLEVTKALLKSQKKPDGGETKPDIESAIGYNQLSSAISDHSHPDNIPLPQTNPVDIPPEVQDLGPASNQVEPAQ